MAERKVLDINKVTSMLNTKFGVPNAATVLTMTSLEIAELCGKEHYHILRDIREEFERAEIADADFSVSYKDASGRTLPCYKLPKDECLFIVSKYEAKLRWKIIQRWSELERNAPKLSRVEQALRNLELEIENERLEKELEFAKPKVKALEDLSEAKGTVQIKKASKALGVKLKDFTSTLKENKWIFKQSKADHWNPSHFVLGKGWMVYLSWKDPRTGILMFQTRFTAAGLIKAAYLFNKEITQDTLDILLNEEITDFGEDN